MEMEFTDAEIREELARLGYREVPDDKLAEFKKDLMKLIYSERSKSNSLNSSTDEPREEDMARPRPRTAGGSEFVKGNFTNHGNQWLRHEYRENWSGNRGDEKSSIPTRSVTEARSPTKPTLPTSYSLYELPAENAAYRHNFLNDDSSESESDPRLMKRKTSRRKDSGEVVVGESFSNTENEMNETADIVEIYKRVKKLAMRDCECGKTRKTSSDTEPPYRVHGLNTNPSVITHRNSDHPHVRNLVRCVPFKRMQMYERLWKAQPAIGDDNHNRLRKEVHAKMLAKDEIRTYHKVFVPNPYVVPTEKPRYDLRWAVRVANSNYEMPSHGFYHET